MHIIEFFTELYNEHELLKDQYKNAYLEYSKNNNNQNNNSFNNLPPKNLNSNNDLNLDPTNNINKNNYNYSNNNVTEQNNQEIKDENNKFSKKKNHKTNQNFYKETEISEETESENTNKNKMEKNAGNATNENNESKEMNENSKWIKKIFLKLLFIFHPDKNISPDPPKFSLIKNAFENKNYLPLLFHFIQQKNNPFIHNLFLEIHNSQKFLKSLESLSNLLILHINFIKSDPIFLKYHLSSGLK